MKVKNIMGPKMGIPAATRSRWVRTQGINEEHGGDVKFYRITGLASDFGCKTTFIGRILNFTVPCFLSENVTRDQDSCSHANRQEDLDQYW